MSASAHSAPTLEVRGLSCGYGERPVLTDVSFAVEPGHVAVLLGANGVGKTTLFKTVLGFLPRLGGEVLIEGQDASGWTRRRYAQVAAYVPQSHQSAFGFSVREMVLMGRTPSLQGLQAPTSDDERVACEVIDRLGLAALADRDYTTLSGGEQQMVLVARALAQEPRLLVMDEPCASLDLGNQVVVLERVRELAGAGMAVVVTSHDPNHAFLLDGDVVCLAQGGQATCGPAREVLDAPTLGALYGTDVCVGPLSAPDGRESWACVALMDGKGA